MQAPADPVVAPDTSIRPGEAPVRRRHLVLLTLVAAVLRFARLGTPLADYDETWTWYHLQLMRAAGDFFQPLAIGVDAPLFPAINRAVAPPFAHVIAPMRVPPAIFGTLSVPLFYLIVRRLGSEALAWRAGLLMAVSPFFVYYAKDARPYSQLLFTGLLFTWAFFATEGWRPWRRRLLLAFLTVLAVGSHYYALVYFAAFYAQRLWHHRRAGRREELRADFVTGLTSALAVTPLVLVFIAGFSRISVDYWASKKVNLISVVAEEFFFTGLAWGGDEPWLTNLHLIVFILLLLPVVVVRRRGAPRPALHPVLGGLWLWAPALVQAVDLISAREVMFFSRGFIPSAPYLLTWWLAWSAAMPVRPRVRRAYQTLMLAPVVTIGLLVGTSLPLHPIFMNRHVITEIIRQARPYGGQFGMVVVHHWWTGQYFAYHYPGRARVVPLGIMYRDEARDHGEMAAVRRSLNDLSSGEGVLLIENGLAERYLDPKGKVRATLAKHRQRLAEIPCHPELSDIGPGLGLFCTRIILYGPAGCWVDSPRGSLSRPG